MRLTTLSRSKQVRERGLMVLPIWLMKYGMTVILSADKTTPRESDGVASREGAVTLLLLPKTLETVLTKSHPSSANRTPDLDRV